MDVQWFLLLALFLDIPTTLLAESCLDLGYTSALLCSSCNELKRFKLEQLEENCRLCCTQDKASEGTQVQRENALFHNRGEIRVGFITLLFFYTEV